MSKKAGSWESGKLKKRRWRVKEYSSVMKAEKPTRNPFASYIPFPDYQIDIQDPNEELVLMVRQHIIVNLRWMLVVAVMLLAPLLLAHYPGIVVLPARFQLMTLVIWYLLTFAVAIEGFLGWYFNVFLITDERVIDIDFISLIYKHISTAKIEDIQDVNMNVSGPIPSVLNYGLLYIQTAGEIPNFEIEDVPNPQKIVQLLNEMILEEEQEKLEGRVR